MLRASLLCFCSKGIPSARAKPSSVLSWILVLSLLTDVGIDLVSCRPRRVVELCVSLPRVYASVWKTRLLLLLFHPVFGRVLRFWNLVGASCGNQFILVVV